MEIQSSADLGLKDQPRESRNECGLFSLGGGGNFLNMAWIVLI